MKKHTDIGADLIVGIDEYIDGLVDGILYHHERFDGKGYPKGLSQEEIPLIARIMCIADSYDAMSSDRIYRKRLSNEEIRAEFVRCSGTQFDPTLTEIFIRLMDSGKLVPYTVQGLETAETSAVLKSALLENCLQGNVGSAGSEAKNPTHIRMLCYIIKMKERRGERVDVFLLKLPKDSTENLETIKNLVKPCIQSEDIDIEFNEHKRIIVLFGKQEEQIEKFIKTLQDSAIDIHIEQI